MTKIDIFSGFLGAGKTTLIRKLIDEAYKNQQIVLIENEFGEIGIDKDFLQDSGIEITEMNSGCICCTLVGDFTVALQKVIDEYHPDRILIEPSGVGKLSDVVAAVENVEADDVAITGKITVVDAKKCKMYMSNFGEFFNNQIESAQTIVLSHTDTASEAKLEEAIKLIREHNADAALIATSWDKLTGKQITDVIEAGSREHHHDHDHDHHHHHDHDHDHDHDEHEHHDHDHEEHEHDHDHDHEEHEHHHDHDHDHDEHEHHHDHDHEEHEHHHDHDHDHGDSCGCGHDHHHDHDHDHHHADEVFDSYGIETIKKYTKEQIEAILDELSDGTHGTVLRSKGIVEGTEGQWLHFDFIPGTVDVRTGSPSVIGKIVVIGTDLDEEAIKALFK